MFTCPLSGVLVHQQVAHAAVEPLAPEAARPAARGSLFKHSFLCVFCCASNALVSHIMVAPAGCVDICVSEQTEAILTHLVRVITEASVVIILRATMIASMIIILRPIMIHAIDYHYECLHENHSKGHFYPLHYHQ